MSFRPSGLTPDSRFDFLLKSAAKKPSSHWRSGDPSTFLPVKRLDDPQYLDRYGERYEGGGEKADAERQRQKEGGVRERGRRQIEVSVRMHAVKVCRKTVTSAFCSFGIER